MNAIKTFLILRKYSLRHANSNLVNFFFFFFIIVETLGLLCLFKIVFPENVVRVNIIAVQKRTSYVGTIQCISVKLKKKEFSVDIF